jgi:hypothetical protein
MSIQVRSCMFALAVVFTAPVAAGCGSRSDVAPAPSPKTGGEALAPVTAGSADPARRLTRAECVEAVDHAVALLEGDPGMASAAAQLRAERDGSIAQCEQTATLRDHRCLMAANTARELGLCPMPGAR